MLKRSVLLQDQDWRPKRKSGKCTKCGSKDISRDIRVFGLAINGSKSDLNVEVYEDPEALVFKKAHRGALHAWVCGDCGFTELYVSNPADLRVPVSEEEEAVPKAQVSEAM